jgi:hypothetical protein
MMNAAEFEHLTEAVYRKLLGNEGFLIKRQETLTGQSGCSYRVDISLVRELPTMELLFVIECKHQNRAVSRQQVQSFGQLLRDVRAAKGILVSSSDFQKGARLAALQQNIALVRLAITQDTTQNADETVEIQTILKHFKASCSSGDMPPQEMIRAFNQVADGVERILQIEAGSATSRQSLMWLLHCTPCKSILKRL